MYKSFQHFTDDIEVYAFNSWSSTNVYKFPRIENLSALEANDANRDGDFIRYMTGKFENSAVERKLFILLSDGMPSSDNYSGKDAIADTAFAMRRCKEKGVSLLYFNIDSSAAEYYKILANESSYSRNFQNPKQLLAVSQDMAVRIIEDDLG